MYHGIEIVDFHVHFPSQLPWFGDMAGSTEPPSDADLAKRRMVQEMSRPYSAQWRRMWDFPTPEPTADHPGDEVQADRWLEELETHGIRAVGFVTGGGNDNLARICALHPDRFVGFAHHNPFRPDAAAELRRAVEELGLRGYKLLAPSIDQPIEDKTIYPVWEACRDLGIPVLIHFGIQGGPGGIAYHENISPFKLHDIARDFPEVTFVIPHFGCAWERETLQLCWACPNVCVDTSGSLQWIRWVPGEVTIKYLFRKFYETVGPARILFGSDSSWFPRGFARRYLQDQFRDCVDLGMPDEHLQLIFGANAARLLRIPMSDTEQEK